MSKSERSAGSHAGWRSTLDVVATVAMLLAAGAVLWTTLLRPAAPGASTGRQPIPVPAEPVSLEGAPILGATTAKVAIIEFSDFECPFCARFATEILPELRVKYIDTGKVKLAFRHLPLPMHQRAKPAAEAAECAHRQGKFWEFHDAVFASPSKLQDPDLAGYGQVVGLNQDTFSSCRDGEAAERVAQDLELKGTSVISGARPTDEFVAAFERLGV